jgi:hypothetical protein
VLYGEAVVPETVSDGALLGEIDTVVNVAPGLDVSYSDGCLYLYDSNLLGTDYDYGFPDSILPDLSGAAESLGVAALGLGIPEPGSGATFGFAPSTNGMTALGLPTEKATALTNLAENTGPTDGVSQTSTAQPTSVLVTMAAAGRNPADILIPTQAGTEGSGGDDDDALAGGSSSAASPDGQAEPDGDEPPASGTHELPASGSSYAPIRPEVLEEQRQQQLAEFARSLGVEPVSEPPAQQPVGPAFEMPRVEVDLFGRRWININDMPPLLPEGTGPVLLGLVGNGIEFAGGVALVIVAPDPGSKAGGVVLILLAVDGAQANVRTLYSQQYTPTLLNEGVTAVTGNEVTGMFFDAGAHLVGGSIAAGQIPRLVATFRVVAVAEVAGGEVAAVGSVAPSRPLGGRGPISGREFDPAAAGGPIRQLTTGRIKITNQGIDVVEQHVGRFGPDAANQGMIQRLRDIAAGKLQPTQADLNYYSHELREFVRYRQLGWQTGQPPGADAAYELWNNAHTATLEDYGLREGPGVLYHPSVQP